jgi:hypothetical protein
MLDAPDGSAEDEDASRRETVGEAIADEVVEDDGASDTPDQR